MAILAVELWLKANFVEDIDCEAVLRQTKGEVFVMLKNCFHNTICVAVSDGCVAALHAITSVCSTTSINRK